MASKTRFELTGAKEMRAKIDRIARNTPKQFEGAAFRAGERVMAESKRKHVPVAPDGGALRSSGHVRLPERWGRQITVTLVYGNTSTPYALAIHEHPSGASPPSWKGKVLNFNVPGSGTKYLEIPLMAAIPTMLRDMAADIDLSEAT